MNDLLASLTDYRIEISLGIALLFLFVTAVVFLGLGLLIGRLTRRRHMPDVFR